MSILDLINSTVKCGMCGASLAAGCPNPKRCARMRKAQAKRDEQAYVDRLVKALEDLRAEVEEAIGEPYCGDDAALIDLARELVKKTHKLTRQIERALQE